VERPELLEPTAHKLLDTSVNEMLELALPHALPSITLLGGLAQRGVHRRGERGRQAGEALRQLAQRLDRPGAVTGLRRARLAAAWSDCN
jgi:hypothetical protein